MRRLRFLCGPIEPGPGACLLLDSVGWWPAEHLPGDPLAHDHPPRIQEQLAHLVRIEPRLNPVEAQIRLARQEEHLGPRRHPCGAFLG